MTTRLIAVVAAAAVGIGLAGCGESGSSKSGGASSSSGSGAGGQTVASTMTFGGPAEFKTRPDGLPGIEQTYGVSFGRFVTTDTGGPVTVNQLKNGQIQVANLFTTDPAPPERAAQHLARLREITRATNPPKETRP